MYMKIKCFRNEVGKSKKKALKTSSFPLALPPKSLTKLIG